MTSLFRKQVIDRQFQRLQGHVYLVPSVPSTILTSVALLFLGAFILLLICGHYTRKVTVSGYLVPPEGVIKVMLSEPARIQDILVKEGQSVIKGEPLIKLSSDKSLKNGASVSKSHELLLEESLGVLNELEDKQAFASMLQHELLQKKIESETLNLKYLQDKQYLMDKTLITLKNKLNRYTPLKKEGVISQLEFEGLELQLYQEEQAVIAHKITIQEKKDLIQALIAEKDQFSVEMKKRQYPLSQERSQIKRQMVALDASETLLRAERAGRITSLQASTGDWPLNLPLMMIIPEHAIFEACVFVPSASMGFLKEGQMVRLRYTAFPYQRYGSYEGVVYRIAHNLLAPSEIPDPILITEPVYRVYVRLAHQSIKTKDQALALQAGMQCEADILLERKPLWSWLMAPLNQFKGRL